MYTLHPTAKALANGRHVPMVNIRNSKGQMVGSRTGDRSWLTAGLAKAYATCIAIGFAANEPGVTVGKVDIRISVS